MIRSDSSESIAQDAAVAELHLGGAPDFGHEPTPIHVAGQPFILVRDQAGAPRLLSAICPHQGGTVECTGEHAQELHCPNHDWRFDARNGACLNVPNQALPSFEVIERDGHLYARLPRYLARGNDEKEINIARQAMRTHNITVQLHGHACLEVRTTDFSLLTDPWLDGPAFLGAWWPYPPAVTKPSDLSPDAIWISHEHSDHFHEPTLRHFERTTPIYVPDFPNRRLVQRLDALGFTNVTAMPFGQPTMIGSGLRLTCYEPASLWNDAIVLIEHVDDGHWKLLNLNDAGLHPRIAAAVGPVDVVASAFTHGASGYPQTWSHLDDQAKRGVMQRSCEGMLRMLRGAVELYGAKALLPFAGHFTLWHPSHREYVRKMVRHSVDAVVDALSDMDVDVIDMLPGETWHVDENRIDRRWKKRGRLYDIEHLIRYLDRAFDPDIFAQHHPVHRAIERDEVEAYLLRLNAVPEVGFCEDMTVLLRAGDLAHEQIYFELPFEVRDGEVRMLPRRMAPPCMTMDVPRGVLAAVIQDDLSWDEAHIGYWCRFHRNPDVYHAGFWRLLQAPYYKRAAGELPRTGTSIDRRSEIAALIERHGAHAQRILTRAGLHCAACPHATAETLEQGACTHGLYERAIDRLVAELELACLGGRTSTSEHSHG